MNDISKQLSTWASALFESMPLFIKKQVMLNLMLSYFDMIEKRSCLFQRGFMFCGLRILSELDYASALVSFGAIPFLL